MTCIWILCIALFAAAASAEEEVPSVLDSYPSLVQVEFLSITDLDTWTQECTATILTSTYMLSAASCFSGPYYQRELRRIRAGSNIGSSGGYLADIEIAINYPEWDETNHDISVIRLLNPLVYSPVIQQATIAGPGSVIPEGVVVNQLGWGSNDENALSVSEILVTNINQCIGEDEEISDKADSTLCGIPRQSTTNTNIGSPWLFSNITLGVVTGANSGNNTWSGIRTSSVTYYTTWIVSVAS